MTVFNAYAIGIKLSLIDGVSRGLAGVAGSFATTHSAQLQANASLAAYEARLKSIRTMGLVGGGMVGAGIFGLESLKKPLQEATKFQTEVAKFQGLGLGDKSTAEAVRFAKGMDVMGQSARDNMILIRDATTMMNSLEHAKEAAPLLAKMRFGIESVMGEGKGADFEKTLQASLKVGELRGALVDKKTGEIDVAKFGNTLNLMTQAYVASGGRVKPQDYLAALKTGGVSTKMMNDEMFFFGLGHFMQESGGSRTGTAAMSMFQNWEMGRMPQRVAERMAGLGLLNKSAIHYGKTGHITGVDPAGIVAPKEFAASPFEWVNKYVVPTLQKKGYTGDTLNLQLASLLGIRTASNLADQFVREEKVARNYIDRAKKAANVDSLYTLGGETMQGKEIDLTAKWSSLMLELGEVALPPAIKGMETLIGGIKTMTTFTKENPGLTKLIVEGGAATAVLSTVGGTLLITTAGFRALGLAMQFGAVGGAPGLAATATQIGAVGGSLRFLAGAVGTLAAAAGAFQAGQYLGKRIYDESADDPVMRWFGTSIAHTTAFFGDKDAQDAINSERRFDREKGNLSPATKHADLSFLTPLIAGSQTLPASRPALATAPLRIDTGFLAPLSARYAAPTVASNRTAPVTIIQQAAKAATPSPVLAAATKAASSTNQGPVLTGSAAALIVPAPVVNVAQLAAKTAPMPLIATATKTAAQPTNTSPPVSLVKLASATSPTPMLAATAKAASASERTSPVSVQVAARTSSPANVPGVASTTPAVDYMARKQDGNTTRVITLNVDGRVIARAVDDQVNRATNSGAGMGTTQFDPTFSVPPLSLPAGAK